MNNGHRSRNCATYCPTLYYGGRGSAVSYVQRLLRERRYRITIDGYFGPETRAVVLAFQRNNRLPQTGNVDGATWTQLGVTCLPSYIQPPSYPTPPDNQVPTPPMPPDYGQQPEILPSFPDTPVYEPSLEGLNYVWEEIGDFRYILATNKARYAVGEPVEISFRKRNISDTSQVLRYPSAQLFDFYISAADGTELYRWSDVVDFDEIPHEIVLSPNEAETVDLFWRQTTSASLPITPQTVTLWGVNTAVDVSIPLQFSIY